MLIEQTNVENPRYSKLKGVLMNVVGGSVSPPRENAPKKGKKASIDMPVEPMASQNFLLGGGAIPANLRNQAHMMQHS